MRSIVTSIVTCAPDGLVRRRRKALVGAAVVVVQNELLDEIVAIGTELDIGPVEDELPVQPRALDSVCLACTRVGDGCSSERAHTYSHAVCVHSLRAKPAMKRAGWHLIVLGQLCDVSTCKVLCRER